MKANFNSLYLYSALELSYECCSSYEGLFVMPKKDTGHLLMKS